MKITTDFFEQINVFLSLCFIILKGYNFFSLLD